MTKEQEEAIKYLEKQINYFKEQIKFIEAVDCDYYDEEYELYKNRVKQFETILNMLKEKDAEIEMYKDIKEIANYKVTDLAKLKKTDEIQEELDKKNKIIDLYIDELVAEEFDNPCTECCQECEKDKDTLESCIKQYFERKAEQSSVINKTPEEN